MRLRPNFSVTKSYGPRKFRVFDHFFESFFLENYPPKSDILGSMENTGCSNSFGISGYALFSHKSCDSRKCQSFDLLTVFWLLKADVYNWLCPVCVRKKLRPSNKSTF